MLLHHRLVPLLERPPAKWDRRFCSELYAASESISANIAEGFDRFSRKQFRYFLQIAKASAAETTTRVRHGYSRGFWSEGEFHELLVLCRRTRTLLARLIASIRGPDTEAS